MMHLYFVSIFLVVFNNNDLLLVTAEQSLLGTHFYLNQDKILIDNTLKSVTTLARPYDLVAFIRQSERLARVEELQAYIDAVDETVESSDHLTDSSSFIDNDNENIERDDKCRDFLRDGESLIFKILRTHLYNTFHIPLELKNLTDQSTEKRSTTKILTCQHFCQVNSSVLTFDHLPSIATRYDEQQTIHIDDEEPQQKSVPSKTDEKMAHWSIHELSRNRTSWLAYMYLSRYFYANDSYSDAIDCLRCALIHGSLHEDILLTDLANIVFRYGYLRDAIVFIERAFDYHLRSKTIHNKSLFIRAILHYYLGHLCTIDNRFLLAIQFYNRTSILLERLKKSSDEQQPSVFTSSTLGSLAIGSLSILSKQKIEALQCHLKLEFSLQEKHHVLQTKLAQLNQLKTINDELIQLNALIKRDMSRGQSFIEYLRRLKDEEKQLICDWKSSNPTLFRTSSASIFVSPRRSYSTVMKQIKICSIDAPYSSFMQRIHRDIFDAYECRTRQGSLPIFPSAEFNDEKEKKNKLNLMALRLAAIERTEATFTLDDFHHQYDSLQTSEQSTLTSTTTWPTLTSRLPTDVVQNPKEFSHQHSNEMYPPLKPKTAIKLIETQLPSYVDCQIHYFGLPSIGDYPTVWLPLENKGLLHIKQAFYQGLNHLTKHPLPWSPPLCTLDRPVNERLSIIENHAVFRRTTRQRAPTNRYDTNMLLNLYFYIDSPIDEQIPIEEFGQRLRAVGSKRGELLPEWIVHLLSSLYWRVNGHLPNAIDCGLKAHEIIIKSKDFKQWSDLTLINLANILYLWGKYEDALDLTQQAMNINAHEPITNYFFGNLIALTKNNHTAAQEYYRRTLAIDPTHIYARRQLRLSYCYAMHTTWESLRCAENEGNCNEENIRATSMRCNLLLSQQSYHVYDSSVVYVTASEKTCHADDHQCQQQQIAHHSSIDRWLNRSSIIPSNRREDLFLEAQRAYRFYGLCTSSSSTSALMTHHPDNECSQGFAVTQQGYDIGHLIIGYDAVKQTFAYNIVFTNDYEYFFQREGHLKCLIYGTGRRSSKCRDPSLNIIDPNESNPKHNMTWWRDPSMLYEHLKELIEVMNYEQRLQNRTHSQPNEFYESYFSDQHLLSKTIQEKYLLNNPYRTKKSECQNKSSMMSYTPYLSIWIAPQTKNISLNSTFFKQLKRGSKTLIEPICPSPIVQQGNNSKNMQLINYMSQKLSRNSSLYRPETILRPILLNLLFEKNPSSGSREVDDKTFIGTVLASGLSLANYNNSWLFFHTLSLYWRLLGNASEAFNCLFQSHSLSPSTVEDYTYLSMALILYNSQIHINEAIYLLYESLEMDRQALMLTHFTLANAMARKGQFKLAEQWYQSTLAVKSDFEPAKQRLRAIQC